MADEIVSTAPEPVADVTPVAESAPKPVERDKQNERIGELTYRSKQAEAEIERLKAQLEAKPKPELTKPTLEQSGYDEEKHREATEKYYEAMVEARAEAAAAKLIEKREAEAKARSRDESFATRLNKMSKEDRATAMTALVTDVTAELIKESDVGELVLLHLANNAELAEKIAALPEKQQAKEIGRLEAILTKPVTPAPKPVPVVSKAPAPAAKLEATTPVETVEYHEGMSDAAYAKKRRKEIEQRR